MSEDRACPFWKDTLHKIDIKWCFLDEKSIYEAKIYKDGKTAHWNDNPLEIEYETLKINKLSKLKFKMAAGGGLAISMKKKN